jgi:AraC family transcriptional regulator
LAKIAVEPALASWNRDRDSGRTHARVLARGEGWSVADVVCTCGPRDRAVEEQHADFCVAAVVAGSFQCRSAEGRETMTPGSLLLGSPGQCFECSHAHAAGDRCISFHYTTEYIEKLLTDAGASGVKPGFRALRLPPLRSLSRSVAQALAGADLPAEGRWEELGVQLAVLAADLAGMSAHGPSSIPQSVEARVTRAVREVERHPDGHLDLAGLARESGLSRYHFLRVFEDVTGVTPHQYVLRTRLRNAATLLTVASSRILDIALDCGFGDVSNFNRAFHAEFGVTPRVYRRQRGGPQEDRRR